MEKYKINKDTPAHDFMRYVDSLYETVNQRLLTKAKKKFIDENIIPVLNPYLADLANHQKAFVKVDPEQEVKVAISRYSFISVQGFYCTEHSELKYPYADLADKWKEFKSPATTLEKPLLFTRVIRETRGTRLLATALLLNFPEFKIFTEFAPGAKIPKATKSNYWRHKVLDRDTYTKELEIADKENLQTLAALTYL